MTRRISPPKCLDLACVGCRNLPIVHDTGPRGPERPNTAAIWFAFLRARPHRPPARQERHWLRRAPQGRPAVTAQTVRSPRSSCRRADRVCPVRRSTHQLRRPGHAKPCLERSRLVVDASVDHPTVVAGLLARQLRLAFPARSGVCPVAAKAALEPTASPRMPPPTITTSPRHDSGCAPT